MWIESGLGDKKRVAPTYPTIHIAITTNAYIGRTIAQYLQNKMHLHQICVYLFIIYSQDTQSKGQAYYGV